MASGTHKYRIGVDVGGTNTDGVIVDITRSEDPDTRGVIASFKHPTTADITTGIELAVKGVLSLAGLDLARDVILGLTIGTTHFINAVVQLDSTRLARVAVIRLAAPYTRECPSFIDFPVDLKNIVNGHSAIIQGGLQIDGQTINEVQEEEVVEQARLIEQKGLKNVVLVGVFSPLDLQGSQEYKVREILRRELGDDVNIVCSRDVGHVGFLERENASILNASIMTFAQQTIRGYKRAMKQLGLKCPLYLTRNDGTLTSAEEAARLPIKTFSSGATNSMRGASYLAGIDLNTEDGSGKSVIVVDIGGTTTDVGVLLPSGFPRQAGAFIEVAGVRTNFTMPDVHSIGLGGGSRVRVAENGRVSVGHDSVGHHITRDSIVFGGTQLTATDIAVRSGTLPRKETIGDPSKVELVDDEVVGKAVEKVKRMLEVVVDRMKTSPEDCDLLLVGGGSIIAPRALTGVRNIILPKHHEVANAVGAAIASVSGEVDTIEILEDRSLSVVLENIKRRAVDRAVESGAERGSVRIVDVNVLPIQYVTNQATRIIVRAVGELSRESRSGVGGFGDTASQEVEDDETAEPEVDAVPNIPTPQERIDYATYKPKIVGKEWILSETDLFFIMEGCGVLGTGGGGSPYPTYLICRQILRDGGTIRIVDYTSLPEDGVVARGGFMGSPSVGSERIRSGAHLQVAGKELARYCGVSEFCATLCDEIGGSNGMQSLQMSKYYDVPALDGDLMGRAYPMLNQVLPAVYDRPNALVPCSLHDGDGNTVILSSVKNEHFVEKIMRVVTTQMGSSAALCPPPLAVGDVRDFGVTRSYSQAWRIGRAISLCRQMNDLKGIPDAILKLQTGKCLFVGKIVEVTREVRAGFTWGQVRIAPLQEDELEDTSHGSAGAQSASDLTEDTQNFGSDETMLIPFQNENLCAYMESPGVKIVVASVPDLITILDSQSGSHLGTPEYSYGLRVTVIALASHPLWRSKRGLEVGGPSAFGLDHEFVPLGEYIEPRSVLEEYGP